MQIIQVYTPKMSYTDEEVEGFSEDVISVNQKGICYIKLINGVWDTRTRKKMKGEFSIENHGYEMRTDRANRLTEFA